MNNSLIILPCHSIWHDQGRFGDSHQEWLLAPYQREGRDHICFKGHILKSLQLLYENPDLTLVISGGQTKLEAGPISEALSYYQLAQKLNSEKSLNTRIYLEEYARDLFENVLFLLCRFYEIHGYYPQRITIVGFEFKRIRFVQHHLSRALKFPLKHVTYIGNAPKPTSDIEVYFDNLNLAEKRNALDFFESDWFGLEAPLSEKKAMRDPFKRHHGYKDSNPQLSELFDILSRSESVAADDKIFDLLPTVWTNT